MGISVAICDDHPVFRAGIAGIFSQDEAIDHTYEAGDINELESLCTGLGRKIWQKIMILQTLDPELLHTPDDGT